MHHAVVCGYEGMLSTF